MAVVVTGSLAYDYIMSFPGHFTDHILPDQLHTLSVSFLVDSMRRQRGGCAANIAYSPVSYTHLDVYKRQLLGGLLLLWLSLAIWSRSS